MGQSIPKNSEFTENIVITPSARETAREHQSASGEKRLTPEEEWEMNKQAIKRYAKQGQWEEVLKNLVILSTKRKNNEVFQAIGQRVWVALKSDASVTDAVLALHQLLHTFGVKHEVAPHIAALAQLVSHHRTPDDPDAPLAQGQVQQMFAIVCEEVGVVGEEAFQKWVVENRLDDPEYVATVVFRALELMINDDWWIDRGALQKEMEVYNADQEKTAQEKTV